MLTQFNPVQPPAVQEKNAPENTLIIKESML